MPRDLYSTAAQVLPVLLLALVWDSRFLEALRTQPRRLRRHDPEHGVWFWTKPRVRAYSLTVTAAIAVGIALCLLVLAGLIDDGPATRVAVLGIVGLALATLLTRIWVDILDSTRLTAPSPPPSELDAVEPGAEVARDRGEVADIGEIDPATSAGRTSSATGYSCGLEAIEDATGHAQRATQGEQ